MAQQWWSNLSNKTLRWGSMRHHADPTSHQRRAAPPPQRSTYCTLSALGFTLLTSLCVLLLLGFILSVAWLLPHKVLHGPLRAADLVSVTYTGQLQRDCRPLYISGFNAPDLVEAALVNATTWPQLGAYGRAQVLATFQAAAAERLNAVRTWTHTLSEAYAFQVAPGVYNPAGLEALDYVVAAAGAAGLQIILCFTDNWGYYNGVDQYVDWSPTAAARTLPLMPPDQRRSFSPATMFQGDPTRQAYEAKRHALFFSDPGARQLFRAHVATIIGRVNSITGKQYGSDPTILAWELLNEPRCEVGTTPECDAWVQAWVQEMAAHVKALDPNHLLGLGSEGFFAEGSPSAHLNPQPWAGRMGVDWVQNSAVPDIDIVMLHAWPENWEVQGEPGFSARWLESHLEVANTQLPGKPVLLAEFGKRLDPSVPDESISQLALLGSYGLAAAAAAAAAEAVSAQAAAALTANNTVAGSVLSNGTAGINASAQVKGAADSQQQQVQDLPAYLLTPSRPDISATRDPIFAATYQSASRAVLSEGPLAGVMFWQMRIPAGQQGAGEYGLSWDDSTMDNVRGFSNLTRRLVTSVPPSSSCSPSSGATGNITQQPEQEINQQQQNASSIGCFVMPVPGQTPSGAQQDAAASAQGSQDQSTGSSCRPAPSVCAAYWALMDEAAAGAASAVAAATNGRQLVDLVAGNMGVNASDASLLAETVQAAQQQQQLMLQGSTSIPAEASNRSTAAESTAGRPSEQAVRTSTLALISNLTVVAGVGSSADTAAAAIAAITSNSSTPTGATGSMHPAPFVDSTANTSRDSSTLAISSWANATNAAAESASAATLQALSAAAATAPQQLQQLLDVVKQQQARGAVTAAGVAVASEMPVLRSALMLVASSAADSRRQLRGRVAVSDSSKERARQLLTASTNASSSTTTSTSSGAAAVDQAPAAQFLTWQLIGIPLAVSVQPGVMPATLQQQVNSIYLRAARAQGSTDLQQQQLQQPAAAPQVLVLPLAQLLQQPPAGLTAADVAAAADVIMGRLAVFADLAECQAAAGS